MTYDDGKVACTTDGLLIRRYYFPFARSKRVPYSEIRTVRRDAVSSWRLWGSDDLARWYNLDLGRPRKTTALIIDTGRIVVPIITPDDPEAVIAELTHRGVTVIR